MNEAELTVLKLILAEQYGELEYFKVKTRRKCKWVKFKPVSRFSRSFRWKDRHAVLRYDFTPVRSRLLIDWATWVDSSKFMNISRRDDITYQQMYQCTWDDQFDACSYLAHHSPVTPTSDSLALRSIAGINP